MKAIPTPSPPVKPTIIYDGDCSFCKYWISRWQGMTQGKVIYTPYQQVPDGLYNISHAQFKRSVYLITAYGQRLHGAEAVAVLLKLSGYSTWNWFYHHLPFANSIAEIGYRLVADNRDTFYKLTKLFLK
ncbi:thiol-disulfide oxidoreductase DCC family protein [Pontibacter rugosus]|uniref:Thiol-disulfide oxidoreductase DCC family protein n=1 Tax=Pontibacter rugosus TaxID=1745966 RepID=A0ABW3SK28_9BACT